VISWLITIHPVLLPVPVAAPTCCCLRPQEILSPGGGRPVAGGLVPVRGWCLLGWLWRSFKSGRWAAGGGWRGSGPGWYVLGLMWQSFESWWRLVTGVGIATRHRSPATRRLGSNAYRARYRHPLPAAWTPTHIGLGIVTRLPPATRHQPPATCHPPPGLQRVYRVSPTRRKRRNLTVGGGFS
jgi:hypothetical protein